MHGAHFVDRPAYARVSLDLDWVGFEIGSDQGTWASELDYIDWWVWDGLDG